MDCDKAACKSVDEMCNKTDSILISSGCLRQLVSLDLRVEP